MIVNLKIQNLRNENVTIYYLGKKIELKPLETKSMSSMLFSNFISCKCNKIFFSKKQKLVQKNEISLKVLKYRFTSDVNFKLGCLAAISALSFVKFYENKVVLFILFFIMIMSLINFIFYFDIIEQENLDVVL
jgi:hypothetical protein